MGDSDQRAFKIRSCYLSYLRLSFYYWECLSVSAHALVYKSMARAFHLKGWRAYLSILHKLIALNLYI